MDFLRDYLTYASENEAPFMFHVWAGFSAISTAIGRRVWLPFGKRAIYPNIYVLLVGDAGNGKSIAMGYYKILIAHAGIMHYSANVETPAGLWRTMAGNPNAKPPVDAAYLFMTKGPTGVDVPCHPMTILANEFVNFISIDPENWMSHLNDIYDQDNFRYRTKGGGDDQINGPYVCVLGGLTTDIMQTLHKTNIIGSGFARRTLFQWGARDFNNPRAFLEDTPEQQLAFSRCVEHLKKLKTLSGPFTMTDGARDFYKSWYNDHSPKVMRQTRELRSWYTTKPDQLIKLSTIASLFDSFDLIITEGHLKVVLDFLDNLEASLFKIFGGIGKNELAEVSLNIYNYVSNLSEPVSFKMLQVVFWTQISATIGVKKGLQQCLDWLCEDQKLSAMGLAINGTPLAESCYAIPSVMSAWVARQRDAGARVVQRLEAPNGTQLVAPNASDRQGAQAPILIRPLSAAIPTSAQSADETKTEPPQMGANLD